MENNASNSATTSLKKDEIENRKRSQKNWNSRQSHKWKRTYSKKSKSGVKKKAYSPQLDSNNSFEVEIITTSDNENDKACMDSNDDAKKSRKRICRDKDVNEQIKLSSCDDKKSTDSSQCSTPVLIKEKNNASNLDDENDKACMDSNDDDAYKKRKKKMCRDKDVTEKIELSSDDDKKSTDSSQFDTPVLVKEENNASNLGVDNIKKRARTDDDDYSGHEQKYRMYHVDKRNTRWDEQCKSGRRRSIPHRRLNQSLPSNIAHSTPVREYRHSLSPSLNMSYTTPCPYNIFEVAPIYNGFQLLGDSQLLRFSEQLLPGPKNIYNPGYKIGPRRWGYCVSGQKTSDLVERLMRDECPLSRRVIVLIGTNDLLRETPLEVLFNNYLSLVNLLKEKTETIILLTVPPVPKIANDPNHWVILKRFNNFISQFMDNEKVYCLDVASIYISYNNSTSMDYYEKTFNNNNEKKDYIHLNRFGFKMVQTMINHLLKSNHFY